MKTVYRITLGNGDWIADFACLETAQRFVGNDDLLIIKTVFKQIKRQH